MSRWMYYKLYFDDIECGLADVLKLNGRRELVVYFHFPEEADNEAQNLGLSFSMKADAVQTGKCPSPLLAKHSQDSTDFPEQCYTKV